MPDPAWPVSGLPPDSSRADLLHPGFDVTSLGNDMAAAIPENGDCAPSSRSPPDASRAPFPHRSPRRSSANAACGGLKPPSARAAAKGHTFISCTASRQEALPTNRTPLHVRGTRRFSNSVADDGSPNCRFAEFSSKWRTCFTHLRGGSYNRTVVQNLTLERDLTPIRHGEVPISK